MRQRTMADVWDEQAWELEVWVARNPNAPDREIAESKATYLRWLAADARKNLPHCSGGHGPNGAPI